MLHFVDRTALSGYVVTPLVRESLEQLLSGAAAHSGRRAWRVTGDYGSGKSSLALALARLRTPVVPPELMAALASEWPTDS